MALNFELEENSRRYNANIQRIIEKYDKPFLKDDVLDLAELEVVEDNGYISSCEPKQFGTCRLGVTKRRGNKGNDSAYGTSKNSTISSEIEQSMNEISTLDAHLIRYRGSDNSAHVTATEDIRNDVLNGSDDGDNLAEPSDAETISDISDSSVSEEEGDDAHLADSEVGDVSPAVASSRKKQTDRRSCDGDIDTDGTITSRLPSLSSPKPKNSILLDKLFKKPAPVVQRASVTQISENISPGDSATGDNTGMPKKGPQAGRKHLMTAKVHAKTRESEWQLSSENSASSDDEEEIVLLKPPSEQTVSSRPHQKVTTRPCDFNATFTVKGSNKPEDLKITWKMRHPKAESRSCRLKSNTVNSKIEDFASRRKPDCGQSTMQANRREGMLTDENNISFKPILNSTRLDQTLPPQMGNTLLKKHRNHYHVTSRNGLLANSDTDRNVQPIKGGMCSQPSTPQESKNPGNSPYRRENKIPDFSLRKAAVPLRNPNDRDSPEEFARRIFEKKRHRNARCLNSPLFLSKNSSDEEIVEAPSMLHPPSSGSNTHLKKRTEDGISQPEADTINRSLPDPTLILSEGSSDEDTLNTFHPDVPPFAGSALENGPIDQSSQRDVTRVRMSHFSPEPNRQLESPRSGSVTPVTCHHHQGNRVDSDRFYRNQFRSVPPKLLPRNGGVGRNYWSDLARRTGRYSSEVLIHAGRPLENDNRDTGSSVDHLNNSEDALAYVMRQVDEVFYSAARARRMAGFISPAPIPKSISESKLLSSEGISVSPSHISDRLSNGLRTQSKVMMPAETNTKLDTKSRRCPTCNEYQECESREICLNEQHNQRSDQMKKYSCEVYDNTGTRSNEPVQTESQHKKYRSSHVPEETAPQLSPTRFSYNPNPPKISCKNSMDGRLRQTAVELNQDSTHFAEQTISMQMKDHTKHVRRTNSSTLMLDTTSTPIASPRQTISPAQRNRQAKFEPIAVQHTGSPSVHVVGSVRSTDQRHDSTHFVRPTASPAQTKGHTKLDRQTISAKPMQHSSNVQIVRAKATAAQGSAHQTDCNHCIRPTVSPAPRNGHAKFDRVGQLMFPRPIQDSASTHIVRPKPIRFQGRTHETQNSSRFDSPAMLDGIHSVRPIVSPAGMDDHTNFVRQAIPPIPTEESNGTPTTGSKRSSTQTRDSTHSVRGSKVEFPSDNTNTPRTKKRFDIACGISTIQSSCTEKFRQNFKGQEDNRYLHSGRFQPQSSGSSLNYPERLKNVTPTTTATVRETVDSKGKENNSYERSVARSSGRREVGFDFKKFIPFVSNQDKHTPKRRNEEKGSGKRHKDRSRCSECSNLKADCVCVYDLGSGEESDDEVMCLSLSDLDRSGEASKSPRNAFESRLKRLRPKSRRNVPARKSLSGTFSVMVSSDSGNTKSPRSANKGKDLRKAALSYSKRTNSPEMMSSDESSPATKKRRTNTSQSFDSSLSCEGPGTCRKAFCFSCIDCE